MPLFHETCVHNYDTSTYSPFIFPFVAHAQNQYGAMMRKIFFSSIFLRNETGHSIATNLSIHDNSSECVPIYHQHPIPLSFRVLFFLMN